MINAERLTAVPLAGAHVAVEHTRFRCPTSTLCAMDPIGFRALVSKSLGTPSWSRALKHGDEQYLLQISAFEGRVDISCFVVHVGRKTDSVLYSRSFDDNDLDELRRDQVGDQRGLESSPAFLKALCLGMRAGQSMAGAQQSWTPPRVVVSQPDNEKVSIEVTLRFTKAGSIDALLELPQVAPAARASGHSYAYSASTSTSSSASARLPPLLVEFIISQHEEAQLLREKLAGAGVTMAGPSQASQVSATSSSSGIGASWGGVLYDAGTMGASQATSQPLGGHRSAPSSAAASPASKAGSITSDGRRGRAGSDASADGRDGLTTATNVEAAGAATAGASKPPRPAPSAPEPRNILNPEPRGGSRRPPVVKRHRTES